MTRRALIAGVCSMSLVAAACSHDLQVKNMAYYETPFATVNPDRPLRLAVRPFQGSQDDLFYFNTLLERLNASKLFSQMEANYVRDRPGAPAPDLILTIRPMVNYRTSIWNFFVNWPGFLVLTPAWNGYVYRADILTTVEFQDGKGKFDELQVPISYSIRHADIDRTLFTGLTWLEVSALAFFGGIYNASSFDRDVIPPLQLNVKDNYAQYVLRQLDPRIEAAARSFAPVEPPPSAAGTESTENPPAPAEVR